MLHITKPTGEDRYLLLPATYYHPLPATTRYLLLPATCRLQLQNTGAMVPTMKWSLYRDAFRARLGSTWNMVRDEQVLHHSPLT